MSWRVERAVWIGGECGCGIGLGTSIGMIWVKSSRNDSGFDCACVVCWGELVLVNGQVGCCVEHPSEAVRWRGCSGVTKRAADGERMRYGSERDRFASCVCHRWE